MAKYRSRGGGLDGDTIGFVMYVLLAISVIASLALLIRSAVEAKSGHKISTTERNVGIFLGVVVVVSLIALRVVPFTQ